MCSVDLSQVPKGLNATELERYLGEHGASPASLAPLETVGDMFP
jgi:hypothetical protein